MAIKKNNPVPLSPEISVDLINVNLRLLYVLELLTRMESRTTQEQVYFDNILAAAKILPINNNTELHRFC